MSAQPLFNTDLIQRYDVQGPRYTSYPTALQFHDGFSVEDYRACAKRSNDLRPVPLSLYFHIPFCDTVCYYCACTKIITRNHKHAEGYLQRLFKEIELQSQLFDGSRKVEQLHWGGGTPTFLNAEQMTALMETTRLHFDLATDDEGEFSIEVDPRTVDEEGIALLRDLGFNRISMGVQDFDKSVQTAVNRIQSEEQTYNVIKAAREHGFFSVSIDLIYGLPHQSQKSFSATLDKIIEMSPDRLSVFNYAHLPRRFKTQRQINERDLPAPEEKLLILKHTTERLLDAGYCYIGMDHFAKPEDALWLAQQEGSLYRNFQGYSTHGNCDLIGLGMSSIGSVGNCYSQNAKDLEKYYEFLDKDTLPVIRGVTLSDDDILRRDVISSLICNFKLATATIEERYGITFWEYFKEERDALDKLSKDNLIEIDESQLRVTDDGRYLIRNICMVFDRYLKKVDPQQSFSKVI